MEVATVASRFLPAGTTLQSPKTSLATIRNRAFLPSSSIRASFSTNSPSPYIGGSICNDFSGPKIRPESINPSFSPSSSRDKRNVVTMVIPYSRGRVWEQPPPDLASYIFKNRIVYLGMNLVPAVTELLLAEFLYLQYEDVEKPIYFYINSTGTTRGNRKLGYETEALAVYDTMGYVKAPIFTLCVGNAWGEAVLLLAAGKKGNRSALPSSTIMMKQPIGRFQGQVTDMNIMRKEASRVKELLVERYAKHMGKTTEQIYEDIKRPKYFSPSEAVEYGIIDKVLYNEKAKQDTGVLAELNRAQLI